MKKLFVKNDAREDFVGYVHIKVTTPNDKIIFDIVDKMDKLVVSDYTRDTNILQMVQYPPQLNSKAWASTLLTATDSGSSKKVLGLSKYLIERKKAGRIELHGGEWELFAMPVVPSDEQSLVCMYRLHKEFDSSKEATKSLEAQSSNSMKKLLHGHVPTISVSKAPNSSSTDHQRKSNPLLSLLSSVEATRSKLAMAAPKKNSVMEDFVQQLRKKLTDLISDTAIPHIFLEPMDKPKRTLVHEIVGDYPTLMSVSYGDFLDRHVRVYRKGEEPQDAEAPPPLMPLSVPQSQPQPRLKRKATAVAAISEEELVAVHQVGGSKPYGALLP